jgi:transposase
MSKRQPKVSYWQDAPMPREQIVLFAETLEDRIPEDHPVRLLDEILGRMDWLLWEAEYHGSFGQPPIHPSILAKALLFAMLRRIRSSRMIEYEIKHSADFIWLVSGRTIDHVTISNFRRKHTKQLKDLHRQVVKVAIDLGLAKLSELCIDGSRVLASANRYKTWTAKKVRLALEEVDRQIAQALEDMEATDSVDELLEDGESADHLPGPLRDLKARRKQLDEHFKTLEQMDADRKANGIDPQKNPAQLPKTDPDARILPNKEGGYAANYTPMATTETENGFIVYADVVIGNVEHDQMVSTLDHVEAEHGVTVETVMGDTAYSTGPNLSAMEDRRTELLAPLAEPKCKDNPAIREDPTQPVAEEDLDRLPKNPQTKRFDKSAFIYDEEADCYYCPAGKKLPRSGKEKKIRGGKPSFQLNYTCYECAGCPLAASCRKNPNAKKGRKVTHDLHEGARRRHRERMRLDESKERYKTRQHIGESPFAVLKAVMGLRRFLLRGREGVQTEWLWGTTAFNLKKLIGLVGPLRADLATNLEVATK